MDLNLNFKQFVELVEKPMNHIDVLGSELGIDPEQVKTNPNILTNFTLGDISYNKAIYRIIDYVYKNNEITHVKIEIKPYEGVDRRKFQKISGKYAEVPDDQNHRILMLPIKQFNKIMTRGMDSMGQSADSSLPGLGNMGI